ncbi:MAG: autotransporter-associated beta strand repeat-containing protein, partial [Verrucomicrobiaceae bacterium]|nr:autotransporter-associated beta strand repeat-containing protein [Verrucomicrobiaceae bacterium]
SITNNGALVLDNDSSAMFSQTISGSGTLTKNGSGSLQMLGGLNTFSGLTTIAEGTLEVMTTNAMGSTAAGTVVQSGATLWLKNHYNAAEPLTLNGTGDGGAGALRTSSGYNVSYAGPITAATDATISVTDSLTLTGGLVKDGTVLTLAGGGTFNINTTGISGSSPNSDLVVDGSTVNLNVASTYNGPTYVQNGGTLNANVTGALPTSPRSAIHLDPGLSSGSTLALGASQVVEFVSGVISSSIALGSHDLTVGSTSPSNAPFAGVISGTGGIVKDGTNGWTLTGTSNTYSGSTTLAGGTLGIHGDGSLGAYPLTPTNKIFFTGNATLQDAGNHVTLGANRGISIASGVTGTFDATGNTFTIDSVISGSGAATFAGFALSNSVLNGSNTYDGITTVTGAATLHANVNNALGTAAAGTIVNSGAALLLNSVAYTTAEALTINGSGGLNGGALVSSGTSSYAGLITAATHSTIQNSGTLTLTGGLVKDGTTLTLAGNGTYNINSIGISGSSPNSDLVVDGAIVSLNAASSYNGPTYVQNGGTLNANVTGAMPTSPRSAVHLDITGSGGSMLSLGASQEVELV